MGNCCCDPVLRKLKRTSSQVEPTALDQQSAKTTTKIILTPHERKIILDTWRRINFDLTTRGIRIFKIILVRPEVKALFPFANLSEEAMVNDPRFRAHACRFVQSVAAVVEELEAANPAASGSFSTIEEQIKRTCSEASATDDINTAWRVGQLLHSLGQTHAKIPNLTAEFFQEAAEVSTINAMTHIWKEDLGRHWSPEVEETWVKLFRFIVRQVYEGIASAKKQHKTSHDNRRSSVFSRIFSAFHEGRKWEDKAAVSNGKAEKYHEHSNNAA